ncbi:leucine-rich repeat domain-containing protein [Allorhizocola rhizosphaerae]|uniref:leucine-rich repeat domain-containing protein n=1 Tax=Allorhizocola rhizosphaerae TaxID=1872709 RepID=UPI000E3C79B7|nr:leucine-rich repeat domain-containing protein [Allorhizocola rhizosphaerae]
MAVQQRIVVPFSGHVIGQGFNSETGERVGTGLEVREMGEDKTASGQQADFRFQMLTSQRSLEKALNFGAEVDARYMLFSGGASFSFAEQSAVNTTSTYILASAFVSNALRFGKAFIPNASAQPLVTAGDLDGFRRAFGDRFVEALQTGGEFHALVRVTSSDVTHQRRIAAALHAELNGLAASVSFSASLQQASSDQQSHTEVSIQVHQTGGVGPQVQIPGTEADKIREHMNRFAQAAHQNARAYRAELVTYDTLALPFPAMEELEDRRKVLEDCLERRQRYLSIVADLTFAQSEDAPLIFEDLPAPQRIVELQNAFRSILNDLMTHARKVARGEILPALFVAAGEPPVPHFKRRRASRFREWWAKRNDPSLLRDEKILLTAIAERASFALTVPLETAPAETVERAADKLDELDLPGADGRELRSIAVLPEMIDAPLRILRISAPFMETLTGIETFTRLEELSVTETALRDLTPVAAVAGLRKLNLTHNVIHDLSPLRANTALESLSFAGNQIESLDVLGELPSLRRIAMGRAEPIPAPPLETNPIADARALSRLPQLTNPFFSHSRVRLKLFTLSSGALAEAGVASRIGATNRFTYVPDGGGPGDEALVLGAARMRFTMFAEPIVIVGLRLLAKRKNAAAVMRMEPLQPVSVPAPVLAQMRFGPVIVEDLITPGDAFSIRTIVRGVAGLADFLLEVEPA